MSAPISNPEHTASRDRPSRMMVTAIALFAIGLLAVAVVFGLYAFGHTELPLWLSVTAVGCTSAGFGLGLITLVREARSQRVTHV
ncbi:hypothetical protein [Haloechinothrix sp. LS1_15]|uniref:hypothetical protein n=1 Tax=Haloechinothrix sp. LS1_15 TaxID=2652248 RepID=UPI002945B91C|nr:hypothetical protein [Haloechinothrix sp. LS1_15]MDV6014373.1 hypothetical protein [Haloechinothrix sp. LS1_15]